MLRFSVRETAPLGGADNRPVALPPYPEFSGLRSVALRTALSTRVAFFGRVRFEAINERKEKMNRYCIQSRLIHPNAIEVLEQRGFIRLITVRTSRSKRRGGQMRFQKEMKRA